MKKEHTSPEDFMMDLDFRKWVLEPQPESDLFWKTWMRNNPDQIKALLLAKELILKLEFENSQPSQGKYDQVLQNILAGNLSERAGNHHSGKASSFSLNQFIKVAAVLVLAGFLSLTYYFINNQYGDQSIPVTQAMVKENPSGRKSQVFLPDGSVVWLNSESRIEYETNEEDKSRVVNLVGEAFFDVAKDKSRPFIVRTSNCSVTAIGTQFNVKAFPNDKDHKVSLAEGKVSVEGYDGAKSEGVLLNPGEALSVGLDGSKEKTSFNPKEAMGWKVGILYFEDASFEEVTDKLQRWYGKKITVENSSKVGEWKFSSEFQDETLENVLRTISYAKKFKYTIENKTVKLIF